MLIKRASGEAGRTMLQAFACGLASSGAYHRSMAAFYSQVRDAWSREK